MIAVLVAVQVMFALFLQCAFTQKIGLRSPTLASSMICLAMILLARSPLCHPQGYASRFERETQNPLGFAIDVEGV
jgi:hypothetical protein